MEQGSRPLKDRIESMTPLQRAFLKNKELERRLERVLDRDKEPIAVLGIGCRFPGGANTPDGFWTLLRDGIDAIQPVPPSRWDPARYFDADDEFGKRFPNWAGLAEGMDLFDSEFFGISPAECFHLDPQQRVLLMVTYEALERACIRPEGLSGSSTGVFVGIAAYDYAVRIAKEVSSGQIGPYTGIGNSGSAAAGRLAYFFGLQGPCMALDSACSASLVAVHQASLSLRLRECDLALAGGVNFLTALDTHISLAKAGMLAKDGRCKTFDSAADGYVRAEGCGILVLKRLSDALENRDPILALIRASSVAQDGRSGGLTVPNRLAQETLIRNTWAKANVTPDALDYIETHGTGTPLGDPIEVDALASVLRKTGFSREELLIGSVKSNVGHLEAAAGVAGLAKTILALHHEAIPPHLHFHHPNPRIAWDSIPIRVNTTLRDWKRGSRPRLAGVSSFGFAGTISHMILQEAPLTVQEDRAVSGDDRVVKFSGKSDTALRDLAARCEKYLRAPQFRIEDVSYTANVCRTSFEHRIAVVASTATQVSECLADFLAGKPNSRVFHGIGDPSLREKLVTPIDIGGTADPLQRCQEIARLFVSGVNIDWEGVESGSGGRKIELPTYPFQLKRYWYSSDLEPNDSYSRDNSYHIVWQPLPETAVAAFDKHPGRLQTTGEGAWLILSDSAGYAKRFQERLEAGGARCISVDAGAVEPRNPEDFRQLFERLKQSGLKQLDGVAHFWSLDVPAQIHSGARTEREVGKLLAGCLNCIRAATQVAELRARRFVLITSRTAPVGEEVVLPERAALVGLGKVIQLEVPEVETSIIDLDANPSDADWQLCLDALAQSEGQHYNLLAIRQGRLWIPELHRLPGQPPAARLSVSSGNDAWYLIAGGLGTLGVGMAEWLAERGAKRLVLTSRSGRPASAQAADLLALEKRGVQITIVQADAADEDSMRRLIESRRASGDVLRGVIHTAGVNRPEPLMGISDAALSEVCRAKVTSARVLHELTAHDELDFFIFFSSIASVWGSGLLGAYSAANAYVDALAHMRRSQGLKCTAINWGPWQGSRMVLGTNDRGSELERRGIRLLQPQPTFAAIDGLVQTELPQVVFASVDWAPFLSVMELRGTQHFWDSIRVEIKRAQPPEPARDAGPSAFALELMSLPEMTRKKRLRARVTEILAQVLGYSTASDLNSALAFREQGMDSILVVQFAERLTALLGREIRASVLFNYPTVNELVDNLFQELVPPVQSVDVRTAVETVSQKEDVEPSFQTMSDEQFLDFVTEELRRFE